MSVQHCIVLGAGVIGLSTALRLAQQGAKVTVIDAGGPASGTTGTTGALVGANEKRPRSYFDLGIASMDAMERLAREIDSKFWYLPNGHLEWADSDKTWALLDERIDRLEAWGYPVETVSPTRVMRELEPDLLIPKEVDRVVFFSGDSIVYQHTMLAHILRVLRSLDVELFFGGGQATLRIEAGTVTGVIDGLGQVHDGDVVVACAGRWTDELLEETDLDLSLVSPWGPTAEALGLQVITTGVASEVSRMIRMPGLSIRPAGGGRLMLHGRPEEQALHQLGEERSELRWDQPLVPIPAGAHELVDKARTRIRNMQSVRAQSSAAAVRPLTGDGLPAVGWVPNVTQLYVAVTHSGVGLGPLFGELIAKEIVNGEPQALLNDFRPNRFLDPAWVHRPHLMREALPANAPIN